MPPRANRRCRHRERHARSVPRCRLLRSRSSASCRPRAHRWQPSRCATRHRERARRDPLPEPPGRRNQSRDPAVPATTSPPAGHERTSTRRDNRLAPVRCVNRSSSNSKSTAAGIGYRDRPRVIVTRSAISDDRRSARSTMKPAQLRGIHQRARRARIRCVRGFLLPRCGRASPGHRVLNEVGIAANHRVHAEALRQLPRF